MQFDGLYWRLLEARDMGATRFRETISAAVLLQRATLVRFGDADMIAFYVLFENNAEYCCLRF